METETKGRPCTKLVVPSTGSITHVGLSDKEYFPPRKEKRKGREREGKGGKGREREGKGGKGKEREGKGGKGKEREGKGRKGREREGKGGKGKKENVITQTIFPLTTIPKITSNTGFRCRFLSQKFMVWEFFFDSRKN